MCLFCVFGLPVPFSPSSRLHTSGPDVQFILNIFRLFPTDPPPPILICANQSAIDQRLSINRHRAPATSTINRNCSQRSQVFGNKIEMEITELVEKNTTLLRLGLHLEFNDARHRVAAHLQRNIDRSEYALADTATDRSPL